LRDIDLGAVRREGRRSLSEAESKTLLREYGIPTTDFLLPGREELDFLEVAFPLVVKVNSPEVLHKTERGGVFVDVQDRRELIRRYDEIMTRFPGAEVLVEPMEEGSAEFIVGLIRDPIFGISLMFGMGGVLTELYQDVTFRKVPIRPGDAEEMLDEIKGGSLLKGFRGIKADRGAVKELLLRTSDMGSELREHIGQMDLNPVIVKEKGCVVVDAKVVLESL